MNIPDFDKTSALIRSSAESANSMSVVGVSPVSIVMGGGPVDGIGTSISNCGIFTALDFRSLYLNNFFFDFFFNFDAAELFKRRFSLKSFSIFVLTNGLEQECVRERVYEYIVGLCVTFYARHRIFTKICRICI